MLQKMQCIKSVKISKNFKPKHKNLKYSITDTNGKIFSNSDNIETLLKNLSIFKK